MASLALYVASRRDLVGCRPSVIEAREDDPPDYGALLRFWRRWRSCSAM